MEVSEVRQTNPMENEVIYLLAVVEQLRAMVNRQLLDVVGEGNHKNVMFHTSTHRQFFFIALVDFLSQTDTKSPVPATPYLRALRTISESPSFKSGAAVNALKNAVSAFSEWLQVEITVDMWLPSIDLQVDIEIPRHLMLKIVGNLSKHNTLRSVGVAADLQRLLREAGKPVELYQAMLAQEDVYERFHDDICAYHASTIAEFLNEISWGIHNYLLAEFRRSLTLVEGQAPLYRYQYPDELQHPYAKTCYWNLMNGVRRGPIFDPFTVTEHLKGQY